MSKHWTRVKNRGQMKNMLYNSLNINEKFTMGKLKSSFLFCRRSVFLKVPLKVNVVKTFIHFVYATGDKKYNVSLLSTK